MSTETEAFSKLFLFCCRSHNFLLAKEKQGKRTKSANLPSHWSPMSSKTQYKRVLLASVSDEFKGVEKLFRNSMKRSVQIIGIERVQNPFMWEKYQRYLIHFCIPKVNKTQSKLELLSRYKY